MSCQLEAATEFFDRVLSPLGYSANLMSTDFDPAAAADPPRPMDGAPPMGGLPPEGALPSQTPPRGQLSERTMMMIGLGFIVFLVILMVFFYGSSNSTTASSSTAAEAVGQSTPVGRIQRTRLGCILDHSESYPSLASIGYCGKANDFINDTMMSGSVPPAATLADCANSCTSTTGCNGVVWNTHDQRCIHHQFPSESDARSSEIHDGTGNYIFATRNATASRPFA
jgi:hypothetical protein